MRLKYIIISAVISLLIWSVLFLFVLKKELTVGLYKELFDLKTAHAEKSASPRFFIIAGSNGFYSHDAETFEKMLGLPATNLSVAVMFPLDYLLERYRGLLKSGDVVYLPLEYVNYNGKHINGSFGDVYDITIEKNFSKLTLKRFCNCFGMFDIPYFIESAGENLLVAAGFKPLVTAGSLTPYGDIADNTRQAAENYRNFINSIPPASVKFTCANSAIKKFLQYAADKNITVIGGLPTTFDDTKIPPEVQHSIEKTFTGNGAFFITAPNRSLYPREDFFDTSYHLHRTGQIKHSGIIAGEMLKKYPELFPQGRK